MLARVRWLFWIASTAACSLQPALATSSEPTHWPSVPPAHQFVALVQGGDLSAVVASWRLGSYELQSGQTVDFNRWYKTSWVDVKLTWFSPITPYWGVLWGFSTGERGPKYRIAPTVQLGALSVWPLGAGERLTFRWSQRWGGRLTEDSCQGDYGVIGGGLQPVNCRLAASELPPAETLAYLHRQKPSEAHATVSLRWDFIF
jgi:hypothetical protein